MKNLLFIVLGFIALYSGVTCASALSLKDAVSTAADFPIVVNGRPADILVEKSETEVVRRAADLLSVDIERVSSVKSKVADAGAAGRNTFAIIGGTLGKSALIDKLAAAGKLKNWQRIKGRWEATLLQIVDKPFPGVERALVIVGSDRRGTAYGLMRISQTIGVSPWYWWADVPPAQRETLVVSTPSAEIDAPAVKYRGIFINDEDWGLHEWARQTFETEVGAIGPKTYEKVFELMLRLRLNYIWPAMHEVSKEFHSIPENIEMAHRYGIVAGASHCEPMLFNNANWSEKESGKWDYTLNRDTIYSVWEAQAKGRGDKEGVWGLGIRGIHDRGMQGPKDIPSRIKILNEVFKAQEGILDNHVTKEWGPVAQAFVPYKEVLPIYDAGLEVPEEATIVWVDDNFGYIRRLGKPEERRRPGGAGVYWHLSYYGGPHSYLWINTTAPALMWEELHKAWENDARTIWVVNVGDIKPMEIGMNYFSEFSWNPEAFGPDSQPRFLQQFARENFGPKLASFIADFLSEFYRLGTIRKPELMLRGWAVGLSDERAKELRLAYENLMKAEEKLAAAIPAESRDAYFELIGFPARVLAASGLIFMADRAIQFGENSAESAEEIAGRRAFLDNQVAHFNNVTANGKWNHMMPGLTTAKRLTAWNSQVRWPWGEKISDPPSKPEEPRGRVWRDAASADRQSGSVTARWTAIAGLGHTAKAVALKPATIKSSWTENNKAGPALEFRFDCKGGDDEVWIDFLPTFRLFPGMQLRVAISVDSQPPTVVEVPGSNGNEDENGPNRKEGIQNNFVRARVTLPRLTAGKHVLHVRALDPGVVIDRLSLPGR